jgi:hypothetical protein
VERTNNTFGAMVRCLLYSAGLSAIFRSAALVHAVYLKNRLYHKALHQTPHKVWTRGKSPLDHLRTFGALVTAGKPEKRPAKADHHTDHGVLLGYGATTKHVHYFDQTTNREKMSTHHTIDEARYGKTHRPPVPQILMGMGYEWQPVLPAITTPPPHSRYPMCSRHKTVPTFSCKLLTLTINEFTSAPFAVIASVTTSDIDHNNSVAVTFSTDSFGPSLSETILVSGIHLTPGLDLHYYVYRHHCQLIKMDPGKPSHRLSQWKSCFQSTYILSIDTMSIHTVADARLVISEARSAKRNSVFIAFAKDDDPNCRSAVGLPQIYFDQLRIMRGHIENTVRAVVHKTIMGPNFIRCTLQKQFDWKDWLASEWIQLDNYDKQNMFGTPCTAPIDWTERHIIALMACASNANASDMFTKKVGKILFARQNDYISSRTIFFRFNP